MQLHPLVTKSEVGSIVPGKLANFTILTDNPITVPAAAIKDIKVWGTVHEGRKLPVTRRGAAKVAIGPVANDATYKLIGLEAAAHAGGHRMPCSADGPRCETLELAASGRAHTDACALNKAFGAAMLRGR